MNYTVIVNKENSIKNNYIDRIKLIDIKNILDEDIKIEENTYQAYLELKKHLETKNIYIGIDSAYRSVEDQEKLYDEFIKIYGSEYTNKYLQQPKYSEHHTGLAIDLNIKVNGKYQDKNYELEKYNDVFNTIHSELYKFGFILRYPKDKEKITNMPYEAWHIRYVGKVVSKIIYENNYTLEEYINNFSGILLVNKEKNMTSFDVVNKIKRIFGIKRVGHTGTLDPLAEGVLIVAIGKATKIVELLTSNDKEYIAEAVLGYKTDTFDIEGNIIEEKEVKNIDIESVLNSYKKTYLQEVPIYSAVKVAGKKLYEYARKGKDVSLPKKEVTIKEIELLENTNNSFKFRALVTKGCYIRSLINDIGISMNTFATMKSLLRTKQGKVSLEETYTLKDIENNNYSIKSIESVLDYPVIIVKDEEKIIKNGGIVPNKWNISNKVIFKNSNNQLLGIYEIKGDNLVCWKNFF